MPRYTFECLSCNLRFERNLKINDNQHTSHVCPSCSEEAPRVIDDFGFAFAQGSGSPANSGVHDHDYPTADKLIGRDAQTRWELLGERDKAKAAAREHGGTHALIRKDVKDPSETFTEYRPMTEGGREARRQLARQAIESLRTTSPKTQTTPSRK